MENNQTFVWSEESEPHRKRTREILKQHPEIKELIGRNPYTFLVILLAVGIQLGLAWYLKDQSWWWIFGVAYLIGAFASHTLFVCIHEVSHNLLFKKKEYNTIAGIIANIPSLFPSSVSFQKYHIKHHSFQGVHELDADMPDEWEAKLVGNSTIGKMIWLLFYPVFQIIRPLRMAEIRVFDFWTIVNWVVQFTATGLIIWFMGPKALVYLFISFFFSLGLHPLGARWIQEHFLTDGGQETKSYYGPLNIPNLNVGMHNEHHDFPSVPWHNLPKLKRTAHEHYDNLAYHTSLTTLLFKFLFDKKLTLYSRIARKDRGKVSLADISKPDVEILSVN